MQASAAARVRMVSARAARQRDAGPELPDRPQHPRRDRAARRALARRRRARDRRRPGRAVGAARRARGAIVHVVEVDLRAPRTGSARRLAPFAERSALHFGDALQLDLGRCDRRRRRSWPTCPTGSRRPSSCGRSTSCRASRSWVVMVQREVGERLRRRARDVGLRRPVGAGPARMRGPRPAGGRAHRVPAGAERRLRAGRPAPDRAGGATPAVGALVHAAFAHRRKALAGSLALAAGLPAARPRARPRRAGRDGASRATQRAERLSPEEFRELARRLRAMTCARARPGQGQPLPVRSATTREDGRHELVTLIESVSVADELELTSVGSALADDEVVCAGVEGPNLVSPRRSRALRDRGWDAPPVRIEIVKRIPVAAGMGGGSADAAAALRLAPRRWRRSARGASRCLAAALGCRRAQPARARAWCSAPVPARSSRPALPLAPHGARDPAVPRRSPGDARRLPRGRPPRPAARRRRAAASVRARCARRCARAAAGRAARQRPAAGGAVAVPADRGRARGGAACRRRPRARVRLGADGGRAVLGGGRRVTGRARPAQRCPTRIPRRRVPRSRSASGHAQCRELREPRLRVEPATHQTPFGHNLRSATMSNQSITYLVGGLPAASSASSPSRRSSSSRRSPPIGARSSASPS